MFLFSFIKKDVLFLSLGGKSVLYRFKNIFIIFDNNDVSKSKKLKIKKTITANFHYFIFTTLFKDFKSLFLFDLILKTV